MVRDGVDKLFEFLRRSHHKASQQQRTVIQQALFD
jgi:hypothetical protein